MSIIAQPFFLQVLAVWDKQDKLYTADSHGKPTIIADVSKMPVAKSPEQAYRWTTAAGHGYAQDAETARNFAEKRLSLKTEEEWREYCKSINYRPV